MGRPARDITNQVFGKLRVISYQGSSMWLCQCECKNYTLARITDLEKGKVKSCGKCTKTTAKLINIVDEEFNEWKVLEYAGNGYWKCQCSCGEIRNVRRYDLINGKSKSCGHNISTPNKDLTGLQINDWKVIKYAGNRYYTCKCKCGQVHDVLAKNLLNGSSKSCGHSKYIEMKDTKVGKLTLVEYLGNSLWKCQCDCGNTSIASMSNIIAGKTMSCGCESASKEKFSKDAIIDIIKELTNKYNRKPYIDELQTQLNVAESTVYKYIQKYEIHDLINHHLKSKYERQLLKEINNENVITNNRNILNGLEVDFYIPDKKLAIEFNGDYYHSELYKDKYYHQQKTIDCAKQGIRLIHLFEHEWDDKVVHDKIINLINSKHNVIYARQTKVFEISRIEATEFLKKYHLKNYAESTIHIGCHYNNELIGVMTFGTPRFNHNYQYELVRLCWKNDVAVVGGTQKVFEYFKNNYNPESIITYSDISKFTGNTYIKLGFKPIQPNPITEPNYIWYNPYTKDIKSRYETQKHKLIEIGLGTENDTEVDIMHNHNYYRVYDSGNIKLGWINN